ncbi:DMT family transporter [Paenibacillus sp. KACC 21273]|uniref:DMT family transporter n=1 Tax=Paenibacillus sp. KACC 21273 TaxID=3025665 RepID=UPI002366D228|nr:DMT family transporter [Paenibacillus sp. KACC 21273]WDF50151.1 DMT family transporter [Paenibacillus sp. KACC 21273]
MKQSRADLLILLVTLCWGSSYLFMKMGLGSLSEYNLIALRFGLAFILTGILFFNHLRRIDWTTLGYSALIGLALFAVFVFIMFGLKTTTTSNAGFLVSLTVIFVPLIHFIVFKKKLRMTQTAGVLLAIVGIGLLTLSGPLGIHSGDLLCILASICYAVYILLTSAAAKIVRSTLNLGICQLGFAGLYGLIFSFIFESPHLPYTLNGWIAVLALSVVCSAFGFIIQPVAQKYTTPTRTGLIFCMEPVFAALFAFLFEHELLSIQGYIGAGVVLLGVVVSEWTWRPYWKTKKKHNIERLPQAIQQTDTHHPELTKKEPVHLS